MSCCLPVVLVTTYCRPIVPAAPPTLSAASLFPFCEAETFSVIGNAFEAGFAAPPSAITDVTPPSAPSWATTVWPVSSAARAGTATTTRAAVSPTAPRMATRLRSLVGKDTGTPEGDDMDECDAGSAEQCGHPGRPARGGRGAGG